MHALRFHAHCAFARLVSWDVALCLAFARALGGGGRRAFGVVSRLGDGWWWGAAWLARFAVDGRVAWPLLVDALQVPLVGIPLYVLLKRLTSRPRPGAAGHGIEAAVAPLDTFSFPSGHTLHAVAFTLVLGSGLPALLGVLAAFAALVAVSRLVLGLHYPSDVLAGALLGAGLAELVAVL